MNPNNEIVKSLRKILSVQSRALGEESFPGFCKTYLRNYFSECPCSMHRQMMKLLEGVGRKKRGARIAIAAPRGYAKSTIVTLAYVLWCICYKIESFIVIISNTAEQADLHLANIKAELQSNPELLRDFPDIAEAPDKHPNQEPWRKNAIQTKNKVLVCAFGTESSIRGLRNRENRPSLIILDDIEREDLVRSEEQRKKLLNFVMSDVLKTGTRKTNALILGTILRRDSLLAQLFNPVLFPGWVSLKYQAVIQWSAHLELWEKWDRILRKKEAYNGKTGRKGARMFFDANKELMLENTKVLWPKHESYYDLMLERARDGEKAFLSEKQNEPHDSDACTFGETPFLFWDDEFSSVEELIKKTDGRGYFVAACDPSTGSSSRAGDPSAIISIYFDPVTATLYVVDALIEKRSIQNTITAILDLHKKRKFRKLAFESNGFQIAMADALQAELFRQGGELIVRPLKNLYDKKGRIESIGPLIERGRLKFSRAHVTLLGQLRGHPFAEHDDGPDALEMAIRMIGKKVQPLQTERKEDPPEKEPENPRDVRWLISDYPDADSITGIIY